MIPPHEAPPTPDDTLLLQRLGHLLRERRQQAGLSRAVLATRAGLSESTLKNLETGRHHPTQTTLSQLCAIPELQLVLRDLQGPDYAHGPQIGPPLNCWL